MLWLVRAERLARYDFEAQRDAQGPTGAVGGPAAPQQLETAQTGWPTREIVGMATAHRRSVVQAGSGPDSGVSCSLRLVGLDPPLVLHRGQSVLSEANVRRVLVDVRAFWHGV